MLAVFPSLAQAKEPRTALAAANLPPEVAPELNRAFQESLPRALGAAGFQLKPTAEVDMQLGERPELLGCRAGGCLADEAAFFRVGRLVLARLEPTAGGFVVGLSLYDAAGKTTVADTVDRCSPCSAEELRAIVTAAAARLHSDATQPGSLEVTSRPPAPLAVDGKSVGMTPWSGSLEPGDHLITLDSPGGRVERDVNVAPRRTARVSLSLGAAESDNRPRRRPLRIVKWLALGAGVAAVAAGGALLAFDGNGTCPLIPGQRQCPKVYDTLPLGAALAAIGGALVVTSVVLIVVDRPSRKVALGLTPSLGGVAATAGGTF